MNFVITLTTFFLLVLAVQIAFSADSNLLRKNRDGEDPPDPPVPDTRLITSRVTKAHQVLHEGLEIYLGIAEKNLSYCLDRMFKRRQEYKDEFNQTISSYKKVFSFILDQHQEILVHNYAVGQFNKDKLDLCSVARYLSHQPELDEHRRTIMKRMSDALGYKCHPCTPYKRRQSGESKVPQTADIEINYLKPVVCNNSHTADPVMMMAITPSSTSRPESVPPGKNQN